VNWARYFAHPCACGLTRSWEDVDYKQKLFGELDKQLDPSILIASSTSFIPWTLLVPQVTHKHRVFIGHPTIPHVGCFMEIYGKNPAWTQRCKEWYDSVAFDVIVMKRTVPGHVFNSFLSLNMGHGNKLVRNGVCSPEDVNTTLRHLGRSLYGSHAFLGLLIAIGGDRGLQGGRELVKRIRKDAVFLILYSGMKQNTPLPEFMVRPLSRGLGGFLERILPDFPQEYQQAAEEVERLLTKDKTIPVQVAMQRGSSTMHERIPLEVGNDPFSLAERLRNWQAVK
jgi:3-hydroxyacyl-CoA dehydrogenase, NAD binding domain